MWPANAPPRPHERSYAAEENHGAHRAHGKALSRDGFGAWLVLGGPRTHVRSYRKKEWPREDTKNTQGIFFVISVRLCRAASVSKHWKRERRDCPSIGKSHGWRFQCLEKVYPQDAGSTRSPQARPPREAGDPQRSQIIRMNPADEDQQRTEPHAEREVYVGGGLSRFRCAAILATPCRSFRPDCVVGLPTLAM